VYSLGAVLYEFLTLSEPFKGKRIQDTFAMIVDEPLTAPHERAPDRHIPPALDQICMRALAKQPDDRYQSMAELIHAIRDFRAEAMRTVGG
jgi:serine/threonine protein kinase